MYLWFHCSERTPCLFPYSFQSVSLFCFVLTQLLHNLPAGVGKRQPPPAKCQLFLSTKLLEPSHAGGSRVAPAVLTPQLPIWVAVTICDRHHMAGILPDPFQKKFADPWSRMGGVSRTSASVGTVTCFHCEWPRILREMMPQTFLHHFLFAALLYCVWAFGLFCFPSSPHLSTYYLFKTLM